MFDSTHRNYAEYFACLNAVVELNRKCDFKSSNRTPEDKEEYNKNKKRMDQIRSDYDREFPVENCPSCGTPRSSFWDNKATCMRIGRCKLAPVAMGC